MNYKQKDFNRLLVIPKHSKIETIIDNTTYVKHYDTEITVSIADLLSDTGTHQNYDIKLNGVLLLRVRDFELEYLNLEITEDEEK